MGKRAGRTTGGGKGAYRTMKIAVLMDAPLRATLLSEKTMARLAEWGEVAVNETDKAEKETVKQIIAGADIAITSCSWIRKFWTAHPTCALWPTPRAA